MKANTTSWGRLSQVDTQFSFFRSASIIWLSFVAVSWFERRSCSNGAMRGNRLLEPRQDFGDRFDIPGDLVAVDAHVDPAVPEPADVHVNLRIVHFLKFGFEAVHDDNFLTGVQGCR